MDSPPSSILVVDDEEMNRDGLARRLQRHGYQTTLAENGVRALEMLGDRPFDLVLLDVMMPEMNGLEVLKFVRRMDTLLDLPIIMVTARGESEDVVEALELGANDYLTKPLNFPVVLARVRTQLTLRRTLARVTDLEGKLHARNRELEAVAADLGAANRRMTADLEAAARIQAAFLPEPVADGPGAHIAWSFRPGGRPAGTLLNVLRLGDRHRGLCLIDAGGPGGASALLTTAANQSVSALADRGGTPAPPAEVVAGLAERLPRAATAGHPLAVLYGVLDLPGGEFEFTSAGHPGPVHVPRGGSPTQLGGAGLPVGAGGSYKGQAIRLQPGDRLVLYTDGATSARNAAGEHFGGRRLLESLERSAPTHLEQSLESLVTAVEDWRRGASPHGDLAILAVERTAP